MDEASYGRIQKTIKCFQLLMTLTFGLCLGMYLRDMVFGRPLMNRGASLHSLFFKFQHINLVRRMCVCVCYICVYVCMYGGRCVCVWLCGVVVVPFS